ncbi:MAG: hypothetical protein EOP11_10650 [Proteobacteria bacterium]|nr:MAG: hypothetical protein EOP11_10650 [Pseudomonadota bacterium]
MRLKLIATAAALALSSAHAVAAPIPYDTAVRNVKFLLVEQFRIDPAQIRDTDSLKRDWLMDISFRQLLTDYERRFHGPEATKVLRIMKATCNNDSIRCLAQSISGASK